MFNMMLCIGDTLVTVAPDAVLQEHESKVTMTITDVLSGSTITLVRLEGMLVARGLAYFLSGTDDKGSGLYEPAYSLWEIVETVAKSRGYSQESIDSLRFVP